MAPVRGPARAGTLRGCEEVLVKSREEEELEGVEGEKRSGAPYFASTFVGNTITQAHRSIPASTMISPSSSWWSG